MKKVFLSLFLVIATMHAKAAVDYNGNPINRSGGIITITPQTSSAILASYTQTINTAGLLDQTFGSLGSVTTSIGPVTTSAAAVALQSDGKIITGGYTVINTVTQFALIRYNTNGSLDSSFGPAGTGKVTTSIGKNSSCNAITLQPDGKIVAAGYVIPAGVGTVNEFALVRYNVNGTLDTSFGITHNGIVTTPIGVVASIAYSLLLQPDGKIVAAGYSGNDFALVRYSSDGIPDSSFGIAKTGIVTTPMGGVSTATAVLLQSNGKIILTGYVTIGYFKFALARYTSDGILDLFFGLDRTGIVITDIGRAASLARAALLQPDDKIVVGGIAIILGKADFALARYSSNGVLDPSFGFGTGIVTTSIQTHDDVIRAVVLQPDGKIIAAGTSGHDVANNDRALARYISDGTLDTSFGSANNGIVITPSLVDLTTLAAALQSDGKIIAVGTNTDGGIAQYALSRYINPFTIASFTASYGAVGMI